ncbi:hypothetical protein MHUMG1_07347 [Metarhizium humberi]|uniref:Phosphatidylethanolamine-binding protein PEBP n=1 Tax=Metarhizium humberi TaxID=2596975 RepID=A0A9P8M6Y6_9HYPO|nr:hypothetical protein MHUMG1_07347 [Metarhizium humberi]
MPSNTNAMGALAAVQNDKSKILGVRMGRHTVEPGLHIPKAEARDEPVVRFDGANTSTKYMVVCLDLDAPHPSFPFLSPILHWIQPGLQAANEGGQRVLRASEPSISDYAPPGPPPGSPPHRYCFFLHEQPASFDGSKYTSGDGAKMGLWSRMRYSLDAAEKELGLGPIVATNYFTSN